jgi:protein ImuB
MDPAWKAGTRDYWRIEDDTGRRFWLFRDASGGWFLHGTFG